jgi:protein TonB
VLVRLDVGIDGYPEAVAVLESSGNDLLDDAAVSTLRRWRLRPATENGRPVRGRVLVPVTFELR